MKSLSLAAKAATATIPIVFITGVDPVALGLVASLNRPGANLTGTAVLSGELSPKRLQLLRELIPNAARFGVLADLAYPGIQSVITDLQAAARTLGLELVVVNARTDSDFEPAFATFSQQRVGAVLVNNGNFFNRYREQLAALAGRHALPAIFPYREYVLAGGLISYGISLGFPYHQAGIYTGRRAYSLLRTASKASPRWRMTWNLSNKIAACGACAFVARGSLDAKATCISGL
jgi:putative tryptophan/tyrosine transport system substrate-binding protein